MTLIGTLLTRIFRAGAMMARSNKKRLNDDDESFGKSNKQPVLSVAVLLQAAVALSHSVLQSTFLLGSH